MKADYITPPCCAKQSIANMDHVSFNSMFNSKEKEMMVNRMCMNCYTHWAGLVDSVKQYTRKEWDALMNDTYSLEKI